jgi:hypothetical protein
MRDRNCLKIQLSVIVQRALAAVVIVSRWPVVILSERSSRKDRSALAVILSERSIAKGSLSRQGSFRCSAR